MCYPGIHECTRDDGETTGEGQGCVNNLVRVIVGVGRANKRRMDVLCNNSGLERVGEEWRKEQKIEGSGDC